MPRSTAGICPRQWDHSAGADRTIAERGPRGSLAGIEANAHSIAPLTDRSGQLVARPAGAEDRSCDRVTILLTDVQERLTLAA
jgi:hypothetical protein